VSDKEFAEGLIVKLPRDGAPDYVIGSLSIKRDEFLAWLGSRDGEWVNLNLKRGKSGKAYAEVDNWKPQGRANEGGQKYGGKTAPLPSRHAPTVDPFPGDDIPW
jgi:hypothetical protein